MTMRRNQYSRWLLTATMALGALATTTQAQQGPMDFMQVMQQMMAGGTNKTVNFRTLKELLPETVAGLKRTSIEGEKSSAMGVTIAFAEADYEGSDRARVTAKITDLSAMGQVMLMAQLAWTQSEIDRESDEEYQRTTTLQGFKAMERYNQRNSEGEIQVFVDERFAVEVRGRNVGADTLKAALEGIDLQALADIKPEE
ncbi:MAG: hypothetical protein H7A43_05425 [Verrucomicrobia bacterium]|mgnify:CR=1 FL=1|nr:hypothetical protein [Kiritimatiellia bacterium]MCP5488070.1 hypothetical protein [Verrucomicrobiota bacterium]